LTFNYSYYIPYNPPPKAWRYILGLNQRATESGALQIAQPEIVADAKYDATDPELSKKAEKSTPVECSTNLSPAREQP